MLPSRLPLTDEMVECDSIYGNVPTVLTMVQIDS